MVSETSVRDDRTRSCGIRCIVVGAPRGACASAEPHLVPCSRTVAVHKGNERLAEQHSAGSFAEDGVLHILISEHPMAGSTVRDRSNPFISAGSRAPVRRRWRRLTDAKAAAMAQVSSSALISFSIMARPALQRFPVRSNRPSTAMPALVAGIHVFLAGVSKKDVDGRDKPGHDS
jgi:hypothetical protein